MVLHRGYPFFLAFDHENEVAIKRLQAKVRYEPIGFELLPKKFTLSPVRKDDVTILGRSLDKNQTSEKIFAMGLLLELDETAEGCGASGGAADLDIKTNTNS